MRSKYLPKSKSNSFLNKIIASIAISTMAFQLSAQTIDVDKDNDGLVDADAQSANILQNPGFEAGLEGWESDGVETLEDETLNDNPGNMVVGEVRGNHDASFSQQIALEDIGFDTDSDGFNTALASNKMQVDFGGYVRSIVDGSATITIYFRDSDETSISHKSIPLINTLEWDEVRTSAPIPEGTRSIEYRVRLTDNAFDTEAQVRVDDLFMSIRLATDADDDGVEDARDIDSDNDGIADSTAQDINLLENSDFEKGLAFWDWDGENVFILEDESLNDNPGNMVVGEVRGNHDASFSQQIALEDIGFDIDSDGFNAALASNKMQVDFGGYVRSIVDGSATITIYFRDSDETSISHKSISLINTLDWDEVRTTAPIPEGTRSIEYRVRLTDNAFDTEAQVRVDDLFMSIRLATDADDDGVEDARDIDSDNDGIADSTAQDINLLENSDFEKGLAFWDWDGENVFILEDESLNDNPGNMVVGEVRGNHDASFSQQIALEDIGFDIDSDGFNAALASNKMQVDFGGYVRSIVDGSATITIYFRDSDETSISHKSIPLINTLDWEEVRISAPIPEGTRSIEYRVRLTDNAFDTEAQVRVDDLFMSIRLATDADDDGVEDARDIDSDNDGIADSAAYEINLLENSDFEKGLAFWNWDRTNVFVLEDDSLNDNPGNMVVAEVRGNHDASFSQKIALDDFGFDTNSDAFNEALASNTMQILYGGMINTGGEEENTVSLKIRFLDNNEDSIDVVELTSDGQSGWNALSGESVIPEATAMLLFEVNLIDNHFDTEAQVRVDDFQVTIRNYADDDGDGLNNYEEELLGTDPNIADTDGDGLTDFDEDNVYNTDPNDRDSDEDGLLDGQEVNEYGTDPILIDSDGDGITDSAEVSIYFSDPNNPDTDNDGIADILAIRAGIAVNGKYHYIRSSVEWVRADIDAIEVVWQVKSSELVSGESPLSFGVSYDSAVLTLQQTLDAERSEEIITTTDEELTVNQQIRGHDTLVTIPVQDYSSSTEWTTVAVQYYLLDTDLLYGASTSLSVHNVDDAIGEVTIQGTGAIVSIKPLSLDINDDDDINTHLDGFIFQRFMAEPDDITADELVKDEEVTGLRSKEQMLLMLKNAKAESGN